MELSRWQEIERLYHATLTRRADERAAFLVEACAGDEALRREVESLLAQPASAAAFLSGGAVAVAAELVSDPGASVLTGRRLGAYHVRERIGVGGMGEVYRAHDTQLRRDVALKVLPRHFSNHPDRLARFEREARVLASLNHPHIGAIYGLQDVDGFRALVLELVDGETLADRIARGPISPMEALTIARQMVDALDAAHECGIVHRDLKPANIKIRPDGTVKVLDFGLAKAALVDAAVSQTPTITLDRTREGVILGTATYMSPEQARGHQVDRRTDVWAFACVMYEMLAGRPAFPGKTVLETFAAIFEREPDWRALPDETPRSVCDLLRGCLDKDPEIRVPNMSAAREAIATALSSDVRPRRATFTLVRHKWKAAGIAGALLLAIGSTLLRTIPSRNPAAITPAAISSLAVLPFVNVTTQAENEYLADGLAQNLMNRLAKNADLRVVSRTSSFAFKGQNRDVREIARELNVRSIVEGSLHQAGKRLRVSVQLTDASSGYQLWSESFDRDAADIFAVEGEIALAIAGKLGPTVAPSGGARQPTTDAQAYDVFLRGQYTLAQRSKSGLIAAEGHFREAVRRDPNFGAAWAALAETVIPLHEVHGVRNQEETYALATDAVRRALTAGTPALPEGHAALAHVLVHQYSWRAAEEEANLAIAGNPSSAIAHEWLGWTLEALGRLPEAERALRRAVDLDPLTGSYYYQLAVCLLAQGRPDEAVRLAERGVQLGSAIAIVPGVLGNVEAGRLEAAQAIIKSAPTETPSHILDGLRIYTLALTGNKEEARRVLPALLEKFPGGDEPAPMVVPFIYAALGEADAAVDWITQSPNAGEFLVEYRLARDIRPLAGHAKLRELLNKLNFAQP